MGMMSFLKSRLARWIFVLAILVTFVLGLYGYHRLYSTDSAGLVLWLNVLHSTISLFGGGGSVDQPGLSLAIARVLALLVSTIAVILAIWVFAKRQLNQWWKTRRIKDHYVICGLGERGFALARSLLKEGKQVVAIELDATNPNIERLIHLKGVVIEGSASDMAVLERARFRSAAHIVALTASDASNLEALEAIKQADAGNKGTFSVHVHIAHRENRFLFDVGGRFFPPDYGMNVSLINVYESAAQFFFQEHLPGAGLLEGQPSARQPVKLLINGFGSMGEAILIEAMLIGHFSSHVPIQITVLDANAEQKARDFFRRYWEVEKHLDGKGLDLWKLEFVSELDEAQALCAYTDILACHDSEDDALLAIHHFWERRRSYPDFEQAKTRFFVFLPSGRELANKGIIGCGATTAVCCRKFVIDEELERKARKSHETYARKELARLAHKSAGGVPQVRSAAEQALEKLERAEAQLDAVLREYDRALPAQAKKLAWENLSLMKKESNKAEKRHIGMKRLSLGLHNADYGTEIDADVARYPWPRLDEFQEHELDRRHVYRLLSQVKIATQYSNEQIHSMVDDLAEAEHNRWIAFHVIHNYRFDEKSSEPRRTHDCLLTWNQLAINQPDKIRYDYQNVYQIV